MVVVVILFLLIFFKCCEATPFVESIYGKVQGFDYVGEDGFKTEIFLGVPYAEAPIGELRFEKPQSRKPWNGTLQANNYGFSCVSTFPIPNSNEDCLTLNIFRPALNSSDPQGYPIMVWIHGGGFISGSSSDYYYNFISDILVSHGIIFISFNYRLGPFGFFTTANELVPGNNGLWDQFEALKFIHKTIASFGGNPNKVTIVGESAGAASVSWLTLNLEGSKYFSQAFIMSGSATAAWASAEDTILFSRSLIQLLVCDEQIDVLGCLKQISVEEIQNATHIVHSLAMADSHNGLLFHPRYDNDFVKLKNFNDAAWNAPKIPIIIGLDSQEALPFVISDIPSTVSKHLPISTSNLANYSRDDFVKAVYEIVETEKCLNERHNAVAQRIIEFYDNQSQYYTHNQHLQTFVQFVSDLIFNIPILREAQRKAQYGYTVYFYRNSFVPINERNAYVDGAGHASELYNFFGPLPIGQSDALAVQKSFIELLMNFVKYSQAFTSQYRLNPVTSQSIPFFDINTSSLNYENLWPERLYFWDKLSTDFCYDWPSGICNNIDPMQ